MIDEAAPNPYPQPPSVFTGDRQWRPQNWARKRPILLIPEGMLRTRRSQVRVHPEQGRFFDGVKEL